MVSININTILLSKIGLMQERPQRDCGLHMLLWHRRIRDSVHARFPLSLSPRMGNQVLGALQCHPTGLAPLVGEGKAESL